MLLSNSILIIGLLGFLTNRRSIILLFIAIELMLLGITLNFLLASNNFNDALGLIIAITLLIIAGAESAIGLSILVTYYRLTGNINFNINK